MSIKVGNSATYFFGLDFIAVQEVKTPLVTFEFVRVFAGADLVNQLEAEHIF